MVWGHAVQPAECHLLLPPDVLVLPRGCLGLLITQPAKGGQLMQWDFTFNALLLFPAEVSALLLQVAQGATTVSPEGVARVTEITRVVKALIKADPGLADQFSDVIDMMCPIIQR